jgi:hypothetical protein
MVLLRTVLRIPRRSLRQQNGDYNRHVVAHGPFCAKVSRLSNYTKSAGFKTGLRELFPGSKLTVSLDMFAEFGKT